MKARWLWLVVLAVLVGLAVPARAEHGVRITYTGPVKPGTELIVRCPDGHTMASGQADFYRDPGLRVAVALDVNPDRIEVGPGNSIVAAAWLVPRGAHYADAWVDCSPSAWVPTTTTATTTVPTTSTTVVPTTATTTVPTTSTTVVP